MSSLFRTADVFQVPAAYMLYFGGPGYREGLTCGPRHTITCVRCQKASVSIMSGLLAETIGHDLRFVAEDALRWSSPLEDLADPEAVPGPINDLNLKSLDPDLRTFLAERQAGARHAARMIFRTVAEARLGQFSRAVADLLEADPTASFPNLPSDTGHFRAPYFEHVLRGLRSEIPTLPKAAGEVVGGIRNWAAIFRLSIILLQGPAGCGFGIRSDMVSYCPRFNFASGSLRGLW